jgi:hypothetical protein
MDSSMLVRTPALVSAVLVALASTAFLAQAPPSAETCPEGHVLVDTVEYARIFRPDLDDAGAARLRATYGEQACVSDRTSRKFGDSAERMAMNEHFEASWGLAPPGALRAAVAQRDAMQALQDDVPNASGNWEQFGEGLLNTDALNLGNGNVAGRVDSLDYDPVNNRLFAAVGTAGVWLSTDRGATWAPIGDGLPSLVVGALAWSSSGGTPSSGGTLIVGGGEATHGGNNYVGTGAYWSSDLGATWHAALGVPDGIMTFQVAVDHSKPELVYVATSKGLYRSADAGRTFTNVALPTGCSDIADKACQVANFVTDVVVKEPGGVASASAACLVGGACPACSASGCPVLAAVGYRGGKMTYLDGTVHAPGNGLYRSATGAPNTFAKLNNFGDGVSPIGFAKEERVGRTELGNATGPDQDHNYVYAVVQDASRIAGGIGIVDVDGGPPVPCPPGLPVPCSSTYLNGIYASPDFGATWIRMADEAELAHPSTGSSLTTATVVLAGYGPGIQSWYNNFVKVDPTRADPSGVPTRLVFGLEEVWTNRAPNVPLDGASQQGAEDFKVIGTYFAGDSCQFLSTGAPYCPTNDPLTQTTTHPDQQEAIFLPDAEGGVDLVVGNDGGVYVQHADAFLEFTNANWGTGSNEGFYTLLTYGIGVSRDCTVWFGLQDNGSGLIRPKSREIIMNYGGDGGITHADPNDSDVAYIELPGAGMQRTNDGGATWAAIKPAQITRPLFINPFALDPTDPNHMMTGGPQIVEHLDAPAATPNDWVQVFDLGTAPPPGNELRNMTAVDLHGDAAYVAFCGLCNVFTQRSGGNPVGRVNLDQKFNNGIATNVGGAAPPQKGTGDGWHFAAAAGLPNRFITAIEINPNDPEIVFVALSGYSNAQWLPPGQYLDPNTDIGTGHVFKSTDAGETFVDISGNLPDVPVFGVTLRNGQLLASTQVGPFISSDTDGSLWAPFGNGLPNSPVLQLTTFPGDLSQVFASSYGRGVWRYRFPGMDEVCVNCPLFPGADRVLAPASGGCSLKVQWSAAVDECAAGDISYLLHRSTDPGFLPDESNLLASNLTGLEYDDTDVVGGTQYHYIVQARDGAGHLAKNTVRRTNVAAGAYSADPDGFVDDAGDTSQVLSGWPTRADEGVDGSAAWATSASGNYANGACLSLETPILNLGLGSTLSFAAAWDTEEGFDGAIVEIATAAGGFGDWTKLSDIAYPAAMLGDTPVSLVPCGRPGMSSGELAFTGTSGGTFASFTSDLAAYGNQAVKIRFIFGADPATNTSSATGVGRVLVDDIAVTDLRTPEACLANSLPVVDAGIGFTLDEGTTRSLAGSASDADAGDTLTIAWTQEAGPTVGNFTGADTLTPGFLAPEVAADTTLTFRLTVSDGKATVSDTVDVVVHDLMGPTGGSGGSALNGNNTVGALGWPALAVLGLLGLASRRRRRT